MIRTERYTVREDGTVLIRTYSDEGVKIRRGGEVYDEAIDPEAEHRTYTETDIPITNDEEEKNNVY